MGDARADPGPGVHLCAGSDAILPVLRGALLDKRSALEAFPFLAGGVLPAGYGVQWVEAS